MSMNYVAVLLSGIGLSGACYRGEPPLKTASLDVQTIAGAVDMYQVKHDRLPDTLQALVPNEIKEIRKDSWGRDYLYLRSGADFEIKSAGPDGVLGTADDYSSMPSPPKPRSGCAR